MFYFRFITVMFVVLFFNTSFAQTTRVLFLGNSYTGVNNLPALVAGVALSNGDTLIVDSNTPGGHTLEGHSTNVTSINKIYSQQWDFVILQEQSQRPSFPPSQVASEVYPYAAILDSMIKDNNPCTETVFYMTWGRKNGDASNCAAWPPVCTYEGMQARLRESYMEMGQMNSATVSPVGAAWKYVRSQNPNFDLYQPDESHPSLHGSYLAAITMYATMFHKNPVGIPFTAGLPQADVNMIQQSVKEVVIDSLDVWYEHGNIPVAGFFTTNCTGLTINIQSNSINATSYLWDFGNGMTSNMIQPPTITYPGSGTFQTTLIISNGCKTDSVTQTTWPCMFSGVDDIKLECKFTIQNDYLKFDCHRNIKSLEVFDIRGRKVNYRLADSGTNNYKIELSNFQSGVYFVAVTGDGFRDVIKLVR